MKQEIEDLLAFFARSRKHMSYETIDERLEQELEDGSKLIGPYQEDIERKSFQFFDNYKVFEEEEFEGRETILVNGCEKWFREYHGGFIDKNFVKKAQEVFEVLKEGMKCFPMQQPHKRGATKLMIKDYLYEDSCEGGFEKYHGVEKIFYQGKQIYELVYFGQLS
mgnify:CR=1 FL=1|jgi:hypothetical protein